MDNNNQDNLTYRSPLRITFSKLIKKKLAVASMVMLLILYGSGIFASVLSPYPYTETDLKNTQQGPSQEHFFVDHSWQSWSVDVVLFTNLLSFEGGRSTNQTF